MFNSTTTRAASTVILYASLGLMAGCSSDSDSRTGTNSFHNGYRLVSVSVDNLLFDGLDSVSVLDYSADSRSATITKTSFEDGIETEELRTLKMGSAGRPASFAYTYNSVNLDHDFIYDSEGRLSQHLGEKGFINYHYSDGLLREASYTRFDGLIDGVKLEYLYNADGRLISTNDAWQGTYTEYEYDAQNQIVTAAESVTAERSLFSHGFEYDDNGNVVKETITRQFGDVYQITDFEYEQFDGNTFNHGLMKMKLHPFNAIVFGVTNY